MITEDEHAPLRDDVRLLGSLLGLTIHEQAGKQIFNLVEEIRRLSKSANEGDQQAIAELIATIQSLPAEQLLPITKAFSQFLNFSNIAEQYNRIRRGRSYKMDKSLGPQLGSLEAVLPELKTKVNADTLYTAICNLEVQLVLTSHPTEVKRRTVMRKYDRITKLLDKLDRQISTLDEIEKIKEDLLQEMTAIWQTPEVSSQKPTAIDEAKWGFAIIESSIWHTVPMFMRELNKVVLKELGRELPLDCAPLKIDSWLGGDRDGNPNVTPEVTRRVIFMARWEAADLFLHEIRKLRDSLSMDNCNAKLRSLVGDAKEPYRELLRQVKTRLKATKNWARDNFNVSTPPTVPIYFYAEEILEPLLICYESLQECQAEIIANGHLLDIIRQVKAFGMGLVRTDIRQEASKHAELMGAITRHMGVGDYLQWSETERQEFLIKELNQQRPLIAQSLADEPQVQDTLQTFKLLAELPRESLGNYIISMATEPSDVLAVVLLQREFGLKNYLPVVPLFETQIALQSAAQVLDRLLSLPVYRDLIHGYQQVMIGYSDSAKEVGMIAASWAQYCAQEAMLKVADNYAVQLLFFHGRGGSLGRGGWPTHQAILSQPPGSVRGVMRVTQQGEVIQNRFGLREIALRTFSVYATSTLQASLVPPTTPKSAWRTLLDNLARVSAADYKHVVVEEKDFLRYFQTSTPTQELKKLAIGSRPASRSNSDSISKLRAIPWVFAWTQNRLLLPSWLGVGAALQYAFEHKCSDELATMNKEWIFFSSMLSMCEMVLAKADINVALLYENRLVPAELKQFGTKLRAEFKTAQDLILKVFDENKLLSNNQVLDRSIHLRTPYLLPLHLLQVELLYRVREQGTDAPDELIQALLTSIAGIAAGMRNTG